MNDQWSMAGSIAIIRSLADLVIGLNIKMSNKLSYPRSPDNGQMSDKSLELCPQYPHPYTGDTGTGPS